jgi:hypothetical protein
MLRKVIVVVAAAAVLGAMVLAPAEADAYRRSRHGARAAFHGAEVYFPEVYYAPPFADTVYCWHWFRVGRGWARAWAC